MARARSAPPVTAMATGRGRCWEASAGWRSRWPRARLSTPDGNTTDWKSKALRAYQRRTLVADVLIAGSYLAGTNTRRVRRALAALFGGAVGKGTVSRVWRKVKTDWAWNARLLADEPIGFNLIDTADVYSTWAPQNKGGESETIIGNWLKHHGKRDSVILATKVGMQMGPTDKGLSRRHISNAVEASLRRLQTDYIDLYQAHRDDPMTPLAETLESFARLIEQGKIRYVGASNYETARLSEALAVSKQLGIPAYVSLQPRYNLFDRLEFEKQLQPMCLKEGLGVISYSSLASGFLTGKYRSEGDLVQSRAAPG